MATIAQETLGVRLEGDDAAPVDVQGGSVHGGEHIAPVALRLAADTVGLVGQPGVGQDRTNPAHPVGAVGVVEVAIDGRGVVAVGSKLDESSHNSGLACGARRPLLVTRPDQPVTGAHSGRGDLLPPGHIVGHAVVLRQGDEQGPCIGQPEVPGEQPVLGLGGHERAEVRLRLLVPAPLIQNLGIARGAVAIYLLIEVRAVVGLQILPHLVHVDAVVRQPRSVGIHHPRIGNSNLHPPGEVLAPEVADLGEGGLEPSGIDDLCC